MATETNIRVSVLGGGQAALILDTASIAAVSGLKARDDEELADQMRSTFGTRAETQRLLLFTNAPAEQFGISMELIARLERVRSDQIDAVGGQEVLQYRGRSLPPVPWPSCSCCNGSSGT